MKKIYFHFLRFREITYSWLVKKQHPSMVVGMLGFLNSIRMQKSFGKQIMEDAELMEAIIPILLKTVAIFLLDTQMHMVTEKMIYG